MDEGKVSGSNLGTRSARIKVVPAIACNVYLNWSPDARSISLLLHNISLQCHRTRRSEREARTL